MKKALLIILSIILCALIGAGAFWGGLNIGEELGFDSGKHIGDSLGYRKGIKDGYDKGFKARDTLCKAENKAKTVDQLKKELMEKEMGDVSKNLKGSIEFSQIDIGGFYETKYVKEGILSIHNSSMIVSYKDLKVKIKFYNNSDDIIDSKEIKIYQTVASGRSIRYPIKYTDIPSGTNHAEVEIIEAMAD
jgi:hypothetical protein